MDLELARWLTAWVTSEPGSDLLQQMATSPTELPAWIVRLRKGGLTLNQAGAVVELAELRRRAQVKFSSAKSLFFTRRAYEQASGERLGEWKVHCLESCSTNEPWVVLDLCCGVGGDLLPFAQRYPTIGIDLDPAVVHLAQTNVEAMQASLPVNSDRPPTLIVADNVLGILPATFTSQAIDLTNQASEPQQTKTAMPRRLAEWIAYLPVAVQEWAQRHHLLNHGVVWHLDPDRRSELGRHTRIEDLTPNGDFLRSLLEWSPVGFVKLAPATELSAEWESMGHWQWLGIDRECKQLLGIFGFAHDQYGKSVAVYHRQRQDWEVWQFPTPTDTYNAVAEHARRLTTTENPRYLLELHPAFYAASLAEAFAAAQNWQLLSGGDYFACTELPLWDTELFAVFRVLEILPLREKPLAQWLREQSRSIAEIKSRSAVESIRQPLVVLQQRLAKRCESNKETGVSLLVFGVRKGNSTAYRVAICERTLASTHPAPGSSDSDNVPST